MNPNDIPKIVPKAMVVAVRQWHNPQVYAYVDQKEIGIKMEVGDFIRSVIRESFGDKTRFLVISEADMLLKALAAADKVLLEMKKMGAHVA